MAHPDLTYLLNEILPPATKIYAEDRRLEPVAMALNAKGEDQTFFTDFEGQLASDVDQIALLAAQLRQLAEAGEIIASAICFLGRVDLPSAPGTRTMTVNLEHFDGERVQVFLPITEHEGDVMFGEIGANDMDPQVFLRS